LRFVQGFAHWKCAALVGVALALAPLLHRFGPPAPPLALTAIVYAWMFWLSINGGVANGTTFIYFMAGALGILLIGAERVSLSVLLGAVAVGCACANFDGSLGNADRAMRTVGETLADAVQITATGSPFTSTFEAEHSQAIGGASIFL
jgi:MASE7